jgi:hypothetical protein
LLKNPILSIRENKKILANNTRKQVVKKLTEKDVADVWEKYTAGRIFYCGDDFIEIIYPGRASNDGGCDFKDAVFFLNGKMTTGDVEVHIRNGDWNRHGHSDDPRYNDIALHVVAIDDTGSITRTSLGRNIPLINTGDLIEHVYYEGNSAPEQERYFKCPATSYLPNYNSKTEYLRTIGMRRFTTRAGDFYRRLETENPEQVVYRGISRCLGYEKNTAPFERLADNLRIDKLKSLEYKSKLQLIAFIIGSAGFLPVQIKRNSAIYNIFSPDQVNEMEEYWLQSEFHQILYDKDWCFFRIRPANHPVRRLTALGEILYRYREQGLVERMTSLIQNIHCHEVSNVEKELLMSWESNYMNSSCVNIRLLGKNKIRQIVVNTILPFMFAYGWCAGDRELSLKSKSIYNNFPGMEDNHLLSYMRTILMISSKQKLNVVEQQGLIYVFNEFCRNKDCYRCVNAMKVMSVRARHQGRNFHLCSSVG